MQEHDYIIVGGGSAGCVLANRLSADGRFRVCLVESGPSDDSALVRMPAGIIPLLRSGRRNWRYRSQPQARCADREMSWPRGRMLGGSSSINAMCYVRGHRADYDHWAALGNPGWSYRELLPYFRRSEHFGPGADDYHGRGGPLSVSTARHLNPLSHAFVRAAVEAGEPANHDFNGARQRGVGFYHLAQVGGERCSNARAFLAPARSRPNLTVLTGTTATRVLFEGRRAVGLRVQDGRGSHELRARREVVLSGGAIASPQLLMLSGIGDAQELRALGIEAWLDRPAVGANLQDHLDIHVSVRERSRYGVSLRPDAIGRSLRELLRYLFRRRGELCSNVAEAGAFVCSEPDAQRPDLQMHFVPIPNTRHAEQLGPLFGPRAYTVLVCVLRPHSRGSIRLASADPLAAPRIDPAYLADPRDLEALVRGVRLARHWLAQPAFSAHRDIELEPGEAIRDGQALADWVRANAETIYHPVGSCRMGSDDDAVVDSRLRVRGTEGLRVIDASVMPTLVGGNTNAPTTVIAEKGADMMWQDAQLNPETPETHAA